ncbi:MAG: PEP-CTERM sorting domain-containing protein [Armatimonadota bacterium]
MHRIVAALCLAAFLAVPVSAGTFTISTGSAESVPYHSATVDATLELGHSFSPEKPAEEVPEPASIICLGCGLVGLFAYGYRRRNE